MYTKILIHSIALLETYHHLAEWRGRAPPLGSEWGRARANKDNKWKVSCQCAGCTMPWSVMPETGLSSVLLQRVCCSYCQHIFCPVVCLTHGRSPSHINPKNQSIKIVVRTQEGRSLLRNQTMGSLFKTVPPVLFSGQVKCLFPQVLGSKFQYQSDPPLLMILRWTL